MLIYISLAELDIIKVLYEEEFISVNKIENIEYLFCDFDDILLNKRNDKKVTSYFLRKLDKLNIIYHFQSERINEYNNLVFLKSKYTIDLSDHVSNKIAVDVNSVMDLKLNNHNVVFSHKTLSRQTLQILSEQMPTLKVFESSSRKNFSIIEKSFSISSGDFEKETYPRKILKYFVTNSMQTNESLSYLIRLFKRDMPRPEEGIVANNTFALKSNLINEITNFRVENGF